MSVDVVDLREFYATPLGAAARNSLNRALSAIDAFVPGDAVVGIGYPVPVLDKTSASKNTIVLMPARQGAIQWPDGENSRTALVDENELPLETASVQCVVLLHLLENVADPADVLSEVWRVLVPEGRLIIIATNRRGLWARFEHTPFGNGRPFSKGQLGSLLRKAKLTPAKWGYALNFPPIRIARLIRLFPYLDKVAERLWPLFCGAIIVCATKRLYQGVPSKARQAERARVPKLVPQRTTRVSD
jgi:SAM-dependent methyltransferase